MLSQLFQEEKILIGMVHLLALPGSPRFSGAIQNIQDRAIQDAKALESGGMDAIIIENMGDRPFFPTTVPPETVASMTVIAERVKQKVKIPLGINVLRNDAHAALAIAKAVGASFIRINVHMGTYVTDQGLIMGRSWETLRIQRSLSAEDIKLLIDVRVKHAQRLTSIPIVDEAKELIERGLADGLIVTGSATGVAPDLEELEQVRSGVSKDYPVFCGSGVKKSTVSPILEIVDGVIVGTSLKKDNLLENSVDINRVREFVTAVR